VSQVIVFCGRKVASLLPRCHPIQLY